MNVVVCWLKLIGRYGSPPEGQLLSDTVLMAKYYEGAPSRKKGRNVFCTKRHWWTVSDHTNQGRKYHERLN
jgi:hypothetical protein